MRYHRYYVAPCDERHGSDFVRRWDVVDRVTGHVVAQGKHTRDAARAEAALRNQQKD